MTAAHDHAPRLRADGRRRRCARFLRDSLVFARRNVEHIRQIPEKLLDVTLQPIMFVLLFAFVFGGAIHVDGGNYREFLIGGILVQCLAFGLMGPAMSIATDLDEGVIDRFRSLPSARAAYLFGHFLAELGRLDALAHHPPRHRPGGRLAHAQRCARRRAAVLLLMVFSSAMIWLGTFLGMLVRSPDAAQGVVFVTVFPLTFLSIAFVPIESMPNALQWIASWNPISALVAARPRAVRQPDVAARQGRLAARAPRRGVVDLLRRAGRRLRARGAAPLPPPHDRLIATDGSRDRCAPPGPARPGGAHRLHVGAHRRPERRELAALRVEHPLAVDGVDLVGVASVTPGTVGEANVGSSTPRPARATRRAGDQLVREHHRQHRRRARPPAGSSPRPATIASSTGAPVSISTSATSASRLPDECVAGLVEVALAARHGDHEQPALLGVQGRLDARRRCGRDGCRRRGSRPR